jgi:hypothetical protein
MFPMMKGDSQSYMNGSISQTLAVNKDKSAFEEGSIKYISSN